MTRSAGLGVRTVNGDWGNHSLIPGSMEQCLLFSVRPSHYEPALGYGLFSVVAEFSSSTASARGAWRAPFIGGIAVTLTPRG